MPSSSKRKKGERDEAIKKLGDAKHIDRQGKRLDVPVACKDTEKNRGEEGPFQSYKAIDKHIEDETEPVFSITSCMVVDGFKEFKDSLIEAANQVQNLENVAGTKLAKLQTTVGIKLSRLVRLEKDIENEVEMRDKVVKDLRNDTQLLHDVHSKIDVQSNL